MFAERHEVSLTTDASGDCVAYTGVITGRILGIRYVKPVSGGFDNGVAFACTLEATGQAVWSQSSVNASATVYPTAQVHSILGAAAVNGTDPVLSHITAAKDRLKIVVSSGGNVKAGTVHVIVG